MLKFQAEELLRLEDEALRKKDSTSSKVLGF